LGNHTMPRLIPLEGPNSGPYERRILYNRTVRDPMKVTDNA